MARKPNIRQTRSWRDSCVITIPLLAAVLVFLKPAFAAGPKAYVGNFKDNTISVIDLELKRVTATIPIPPGPHGMVITPDNRWVYVASDGTSTVSVIDTATDKLVENIEVGKNPHGVAVTRDGKYVLVGVYDTDSITFIDTATRKVIGSVPVGKPHNIAIHPNGRVAYGAPKCREDFLLLSLISPPASSSRTCLWKRLRVDWNSTRTEDDYTSRKQESTRGCGGSGKQQSHS